MLLRNYRDTLAQLQSYFRDSRGMLPELFQVQSLNLIPALPLSGHIKANT